MSRPKATAAGTLFDGLVDCYVLDDGRRVLSQRGSVRALTGGREGADLGTYLARLPKNFSVESASANFEFERHDGGTANGVESSAFVAILNAYVDAGLAGALRRNQQHLAVNASKLLRALQSVGLDALIDEATGYQRMRANDALSHRLAQYLRETAAPHKVTFKEKLVRELCRVYGHVYTPGRHPRWLARVNEKLYRTMFDDDIAAGLKQRNPSPRFGSNHHQFVAETVQPLMRDDLEVIYVLARTSASATDFWRRCEYHFKRTPMQIDMAAKGAQ